MDNPFRRKSSEPSGGLRLGRYMDLFRENSAQKESESRAMIAEFMYFEKKHPLLMDWVNKNADQPQPINQDLLANTARANAFKEFREHIRRGEREAHSLAEV